MAAAGTDQTRPVRLIFSDATERWACRTCMAVLERHGTRFVLPTLYETGADVAAHRAQAHATIPNT